MLPTIEWQDDAVVMIDQRKLPAQEIYVKCRTSKEVARAIKNMVIRGAPAIGVAVAMGLALGVRRSKATGATKLAAEFYKLCDLMSATRPTGANLFWAIERMKKIFSEGIRRGCSPSEIRDMMICEALKIHDEDVTSCRALGTHGAEIPMNHSLYQTAKVAITEVTGQEPHPNPLHTDSDIRYPLLYNHIPTVGLGPLAGSLTQTGKHDEWVNIDESVMTIKVLAGIILDWCDI